MEILKVFYSPYLFSLPFFPSQDERCVIDIVRTRPFSSPSFFFLLKKICFWFPCRSNGPPSLSSPPLSPPSPGCNRMKLGRDYFSSFRLTAFPPCMRSPFLSFARIFVTAFPLPPRDLFSLTELSVTPDYQVSLQFLLEADYFHAVLIGSFPCYSSPPYLPY